jgi:hypothetical protein
MTTAERTREERGIPETLIAFFSLPDQTKIGEQDSAGKKGKGAAYGLFVLRPYPFSRLHFLESPLRHVYFSFLLCY